MSEALADRCQKLGNLSALPSLTGKPSIMPKFYPSWSYYPAAITVAVRPNWLTFRRNQCLAHVHILHRRYDLEIPRGPFTCQTKLSDSLVSAFLEHVESLQLLNHCFAAPFPSRDEYQSNLQYRSAVVLWNDFVTIGCKIDTSENRLDYIIAANALRDLVRKLELSAVNPETFPLCHANLSANNIYVHDKYNITRIIHWTFVSSIPESKLLVSPSLVVQNCGDPGPTDILPADRKPIVL